MNKLNRNQVAIAALVVIAGINWFGLKGYSCKRRGAAFARQVDGITRDAGEELKMGTNKAAVVRFFVDHNIPYTMLESEAYGALRTSGCAPLGCGTDAAFIAVHVKLDGSGTVIEDAKVVGMYQDCL